MAGHFYPPPPPFTGGNQPLSPHEQTPPSVVTPSDNPPFGLPEWLSNQTAIMGSWTSSTSPPAQRFLPQGAQVDNPPFGLKRQPSGWSDQWAIPPRSSWIVQPYLPDNPPFGLRAPYQPPADFILPQRNPALPQQYTPDNPPFGAKAQPYQAWITDPRLPQRSTFTPQGTPAVVNDPPFGQRPWLAQVIQANQPGPPLPWHGIWIAQGGTWVAVGGLIITTTTGTGDGVTFTGGFLQGDSEGGGIG